MSRRTRQRVRAEARKRELEAANTEKPGPSRNALGTTLPALLASAEVPRWMKDPAYDANLTRIAREEADAWARSAPGTPYGVAQ